MGDETPLRGMVRQGDLLLVPAETLPEPPLVERPRRDGRLVLARGEQSGHAHAVLEPGARLLGSPLDPDGEEPLVLLVEEEPVTLVHEEHAPIRLAPGAYEVRRQREYSRSGERRAID
ncbi:MAG TPA: hypothetical protein VNJ46_04865 [Gaiellaceae bacterium]|nr:hypothetical protein [Gaiellaceae bacterium]